MRKLREFFVILLLVATCHAAVFLIALLPSSGVPPEAAARMNSAVMGGVLATASCSTPASGNVFNEGFEGTGYENTGWTEVGTPDEDFATPGSSKPTYACSQVLNSAWPGSGNTPSINRSTGNTGAAAQATRYIREYVYFESTSQASSDKTVFLRGAENADGGSPSFYAMFNNAAGTYQIIGGGGGGTSGAITVSLQTWYRVEIMWVYNSSTSEIKVFDLSNTQVGTTQTFSSGTNEYRYLFTGIAGTDHSQAVNLSVDQLSVSSSGYIGQ